MSTKPSLHAALNKNIQVNEPSVNSVPEQREFKKLIVEIPSEAHYQIDKMRLELRSPSMKALVTEALNDLFKKHNYPPIA